MGMSGRGQGLQTAHIDGVHDGRAGDGLERQVQGTVGSVNI